MRLNEAEVFVTLILQNLCKQRNFMLLLDVRLDCVDDGRCPLDNERLQSVLLVQVCVHELLQSFLSYLVVLALLIEFHLLGIHVRDGVFELLEAEHAILSAANRRITLASAWVVGGCARPGALS